MEIEDDVERFNTIEKLDDPLFEKLFGLAGKDSGKLKSANSSSPMVVFDDGIVTSVRTAGHEGEFFGLGAFLFHMPPYRNAVSRDSQYRASMRIIKVAIAAAAFEVDHGAYPKTLDLLVPKYLSELPLDPGSNANFKYQPLKKGPILYSVGIDGVDDGGADRHHIWMSRGKTPDSVGDLPLFWGVEKGSKEADSLRLTKDDFLDK